MLEMPMRNTALHTASTASSTPREADEVAAPYVFAYIGLVVLWLAAVLWWVFWQRGYA
jgi:hypothetical protein